MCVSYANISHMHLRQRKRGEEIVWLLATERERPEHVAKRGLANKRERSRETYGENADMGRRECMFVIERSPGDRDGTTWQIELQGVCALEDAPRDIEIDVWMEGDNTCVPEG